MKMQRSLSVVAETAMVAQCLCCRWAVLVQWIKFKYNLIVVGAGAMVGGKMGFV